MMKEKSKKTLYTVTECAVLIALGIALSYIKIPIGAFGGSVDFVMVPLFVLCYRHGAKYGLASCLVFGFLKCLTGGGIGWGLPSILLDYVLAYGAVGIAGFMKGKRNLIEVSTLIGSLARYAVHFISGITLYAITAPTEVGWFTTSNVWLYSLVYNGLYMVPNTVIAVIVMSLLRPALKKLEK